MSELTDEMMEERPFKKCPVCGGKARLVNTAGRFHCDVCCVSFLLWTDEFEAAAPNRVGYAVTHLCDLWPSGKGDGCWNCEFGTWLPEIAEWHCSEISGGGTGPGLTKEECWSNLTGEECTEYPDEGWEKREDVPDALDTAGG